MKKVIRNLSIFLMIMLVLNFISIIVSNVLVPKVKCETPSRRVFYEQIHYLCVPNEAIYEDEEHILNSYVFVVENQETVIGYENIAKKIPVKVQAKDEMFTSLFDTELRSDSNVIVYSNKDEIHDGDKVHIIE